MMYTCCFTGHRKCAADTARVRAEIESLIQKGVTVFCAGGAVGWDTVCAIEVLRSRKVHPEVKLHLVLPCKPEEQTKKWNKADVELYYRILHAADKVDTLSESYDRGCYRLRNQRLVELADVCMCYYDSSQSTSGTAQTVRMAQKKGIRVINLFA